MKKYSVKKEVWLTEIRADREEWVELLGMHPDDAALRHVGISRVTWEQIAGGKSPLVPMAAYRLARFRRHGALADLLGSAWSDFFVCGDALLFPGLKFPMSAPELRTAWLRIQETARLRSEVALLRRDAAAEMAISGSTRDLLAGVFARLQNRDAVTLAG